MPGFLIEGIGNKAPGDNVQAYYSYTWQIQQVFGSDCESPPLIYLLDMGLPTFSIGQERVKGASLNYKYANDVTWEDVKVTWYDTKGMLDYIISWREMVWTPDEGLQPPTKYKSKSTLATSLPDGSNVNTYALINSWPSNIRHGDLTYTSSDVKVVDVTISYDWCEETSGE